LSKTVCAKDLARQITDLRVPDWSRVWAAWCPSCRQECIPMRSGRCGFCDTSLVGQPTRESYEPPLEEGRFPAEWLELSQVA